MILASIGPCSAQTGQITTGGRKGRLMFSAITSSPQGLADDLDLVTAVIPAADPDRDGSWTPSNVGPEWQPRNPGAINVAALQPTR